MALDIISRLQAETVLISGLPVEIALDIISRLPAETVLICKLVSKTWNNYLSNTDRKNFAKMHLKQLNRLHQHDNKNSNNGVAGRSKVSLGFIFLLKSENEKPSGYPLYYGEYYTKQGTVQKPARLINHPLIPAKQKHHTDVLVGSCNGLICFAEPIDYVRDPVHICNPITRECLSLQGFTESLQGFKKNDYEYKSAWIICSGFGYSPKTNKYKVVRIIYVTRSFHENFGHIQVYTLGSKTGWRNKGIVNHLFDSKYGVFSYGALHWVVSKEKKIMAFDLSDENFHDLPEGPFSHPSCDEFSFLRSWGGQQLYGVGKIKNKCFDIWSFKNTSSEGSINNAATTTAVSAYNECKSWSWCKEFSITQSSSYAPFAVTRNDLVVSWDRSTIYYYNPQKESITSLATLDNPLEVIPHMNSFVSLKDLGETTCKKRKREIHQVVLKRK